LEVSLLATALNLALPARWAASGNSRNLFLMLGRNAGLGHNSIVNMTQAQIAYLLAALRYMRAIGIDALAPADAAQRAAASSSRT
jgi:cation diffusion facilitator CzcD-associated flavoprotein CzcO